MLVADVGSKDWLSRSAIQRDHELYLMRKNLLVIDGKRNITNEGVHLVEAHCKKMVDKSWATAILDSVMTHYSLIANLIKEYARDSREGKKDLDEFFKDLREAVDNELDCFSLDERMKDYDLYGSWNDDAGA